MELRGAVAALWKHDTDQTVVVEAGAGTGKTHGICAFAVWFAEEHPGARILFLRKVRADLKESTLVKPLEQSILDYHLATGQVRIHGGESRNSYTFANGSKIVCGGLDKSSRHMGSYWDLIVIFEATEATLGDYQDLSTRTSREIGAAGQSFIILDCNPGEANHWINELAKQGQIKRLCSRHEDNPLFFEVTRRHPDGRIAAVRPTPLWARYFAKLNALHGPRKRRLLFHEWVTAEGLALPEWSEDKHLRDRALYIGQKFECFFGGFDWGHTDAGCIEVFGMVKGIAYRVFEVYRTKQGYNWWAERIVDIDRMLVQGWGKGLRRIVCSHEQPAMSDLVNDLLADRCKDGPIAVKYRANAGARRNRLERLRWWLEPQAAPDPDIDDPLTDLSHPRAYWLRGSQLWGPDPVLREDYLPTSWETEIGGVTMAPTPDGRRSKEEIDPKCPNHAFDAAGMCLEECQEYVRTTEPRSRKAVEAPEDTLQGRELAMLRKLKGTR